MDVATDLNKAKFHLNNAFKALLRAEVPVDNGEIRLRTDKERSAVREMLRVVDHLIEAQKMADPTLTEVVFPDGTTIEKNGNFATWRQVMFLSDLMKKGNPYA